jgi:hypothetical protein
MRRRDCPAPHFRPQSGAKLRLAHQRFALALAIGLSGSLTSHTPSAVAQSATETTASGTSYINPFPPGDIYKTQIYGDGFVEGLLAGMTEVIRADERMELPRKPRAFGALIRSEVEDELRTEEQSRDIVHIAVVMLGDQVWHTRLERTLWVTRRPPLEDVKAAQYGGLCGRASTIAPG